MTTRSKMIKVALTATLILSAFPVQALAAVEISELPKIEAQTTNTPTDSSQTQENHSSNIESIPQINEVVAVEEPASNETITPDVVTEDINAFDDFLSIKDKDGNDTKLGAMSKNVVINGAMLSHDKKHIIFPNDKNGKPPSGVIAVAYDDNNDKIIDRIEFETHYPFGNFFVKNRSLDRDIPQLSFRDKDNKDLDYGKIIDNVKIIGAEFKDGVIVGPNNAKGEEPTGAILIGKSSNKLGLIDEVEVKFLYPGDPEPPVPVPTPTPDPNPDPVNPDDPAKPDPSKGTTGDNNLQQTGDSYNMLVITGLVTLIACAVILILIAYKKRESKNP